MGIKKMIKAIVYCLLFLSLGLFGCSADSMIEGEIQSDSFITYADEAFFTDKFGTSHIKIAFNDENKDELNYIEFDGNTFRHEIIATPATPNHPQFSPDGSKIAFSTGHEGLTGITEMYVVDLAQEGRPVYKLDTENAAIPRWRILENGDTAIIYIDVCVRFFLAERKPVRKHSHFNRIAEGRHLQYTQFHASHEAHRKEFGLVLGIARTVTHNFYLITALQFRELRCRSPFFCLRLAAATTVTSHDRSYSKVDA